MLSHETPLGIPLPYKAYQNKIIVSLGGMINTRIAADPYFKKTKTPSSKLHIYIYIYIFACVMSTSTTTENKPHDPKCSFRYVSTTFETYRSTLAECVLYYQRLYG